MEFHTNQSSYVQIITYLEYHTREDFIQIKIHTHRISYEWNFIHTKFEYREFHTNKISHTLFSHQQNIKHTQYHTNQIL